MKKAPAQVPSASMVGSGVRRDSPTKKKAPADRRGYELLAVLFFADRSLRAQ
jgi:hypothetical protein